MGGRPFRTKETTQQAYDDFMKAGGLEGQCALCEAPAVKEFTLWKIVENRFPYDRVATTSHMIVPKRHANDEEITGDEWIEFQKIKKEYLTPTYDFFIEAAHHKKSIPAHFHLHLIVAGDNT